MTKLGLWWKAGTERFSTGGLLLRATIISYLPVIFGGTLALSLQFSYLIPIVDAPAGWMLDSAQFFADNGWLIGLVAGIVAPFVCILCLGRDAGPVELGEA